MQNAQSIKDVISERLKSSSGAVAEKVLGVLVDREIDRRVELLIQALDRRDVMVKALAKFQADLRTFDASGAPISEGWSKANLDSRNKSKAKLDSLESAIQNALSGSDVDFSKLTEAVKKAGETKDESGDAQAKG